MIRGSDGRASLSWTRPQRIRAGKRDLLLSAQITHDSGIVKPSALAVLRLIYKLELGWQFDRAVHFVPSRKRPRKPGALPNFNLNVRRPWPARPPGLCRNSQSGSPEASSPPGSRARGRRAGARSPALRTLDHNMVGELEAALKGPLGDALVEPQFEPSSRDPAEFWPQRLFAFEVRRLGDAARA